MRRTRSVLFFMGTHTNGNSKHYDIHRLEIGPLLGCDDGVVVSVLGVSSVVGVEEEPSMFAEQHIVNNLRRSLLLQWLLDVVEPLPQKP